MKFGGTSVGTEESIKSVLLIVRETIKQGERVAIVCSAFSGVTDQLIKMGLNASQGKESYEEIFTEVKNRHLRISKALIPEEKYTSALLTIEENLHSLNKVLQGVFLVKELTLRTLDFIMSFGERLSCFIIAQSLDQENFPSQFLDARKLVKTDQSFGQAHVNIPITYKNIRNHFEKYQATQVITGFIASSDKEETTTLGRSGSDYTASLFGAALDCQEIEIWTDVDGVMTADPKKVSEAFTVYEMSYQEAMEMSHFGAKVIFPPTMQPALEKNIPLRIKNTFNPSFSGTLISAQLSPSKLTAKGISSINQVALLRMEGSGMIGVAGISRRLFGTLALHNINIILITQGSSEHSICLAVLPEMAEDAKKTIEKEFSVEQQRHEIDEIVLEHHLSIIAIIGENMRRCPGIAGKIFQTLGKNKINVVAVAQGSSELNISLVIASEKRNRALSVLHESIFFPENQSLHVFLAGTGLIGQALLNQIQKQIEHLATEKSLHLKLIGIANSQKTLIQEEGINLKTWSEKLETKGVSDSNNEIKKSFFQNSCIPDLVFVDCTSSQKIAELYPEILQSGVSIVTPNKKAISHDYLLYEKLQQLQKKKQAKFFYETNVGAGLPIIHTIRSLILSGDKITCLDAVVSGTLSYIFNRLSPEKKFSDLVHEAKEKGFTEPDPREDLNCLDVNRKLLILAREMGYPLELDDIEVEDLLPPEYFAASSTEAFFSLLPKIDPLFQEKSQKAEKEGKSLRHIARFENGKAQISLQAVSADHPFYHLSGSDNIIALFTERYQSNPLVIKGPGAGAEVTSGGVFADLIRVALG